ncbi:MAG: DNA polymerase I [Gammaproteobacteria bacterium CG11_big_fil_rev_8_21_14_0_20_46_22]|nr:MAG: DNA polymerase I [Gammaproteobacteria bacterium CG12_big_fil_rev_8_21_14_0_65_46_12]PIR11027.1 MAG: DNA polymerase I [Gammaproteobacteria bacterium CG11_big_fil_rev_8_21_14_0_20_46_22]
MSENLLILVDGSSYLYRAFHAMPNLTNREGEPTGAMYGVLNMLRRLRADHPSAYFAVVFDAKGKTFRHDLYDAYKAHRPPMPPELRSQIEPLYEIIRAMHLPLISISGVEADDVIGTLAKQASQAGLNTLISTGDKDLAQLVDNQVTLINTMNNSFLTPDSVKEKFGVGPELIIDYLTLIGDTSDNIPGVPKVGPKTAVKWLEEYGSLDNIIASANQIGGKVGENLRASLEQLPLSKELVTIRCNVDVPYKIADLHAGNADEKALADAYQHYDFKSWLGDLNPEKSEPQKKQETEYHIINDEKALDVLIDRLNQASLFAFDTETNSLNYMQASIVGVSFALKAHEAFYIPLAHEDTSLDQLDRDTTLQKLKPLLENEGAKKVGQNLKYDREVLQNHGITLRGIAFDTMLESYVFNSTASRHDMDSLALKYLGYTTVHYEDIAGKGAKQITFDQVDIQTAANYAAEDADITLQLHEKLWPKLANDEKLKQVFETIEMPLVPILSDMERTGVMIDAEKLQQQSAEITERLSVLEKEAHTIAGEPFNLASPKQLQTILFEKLNLPVLKKTPKGQPSTAEDVLSDLAADFELPKILLEHRSLAKLKSTYTDRLPEQIDPNNGRVHTSFHQAVAGTGRLSSSGPNLQNIPTRTEEGRRIRQAFIAQKDYQIVSADYSQIELRIMAHLSNDKGLLEAFEKGLDVHKATASQVFGVALNDVTNDQRRKSKAINFGLIYGMSAFGLAKQIGVDRATAQAYIDAYFEQYPGVLDYMERTRAQAHEKGYVETLFGRRLYLNEINSRNKMRQKAAERAAINAPMQGTAADIIKRAMILVSDFLHQSDVDARMIMQVHDELVFEVKDTEVDVFTSAIVDIMGKAATLNVPLIADAGSGNNWDEAH